MKETILSTFKFFLIVCGGRSELEERNNARQSCELGDHGGGEAAGVGWPMHCNGSVAATLPLFITIIRSYVLVLGMCDVGIVDTLAPATVIINQGKANSK